MTKQNLSLDEIREGITSIDEQLIKLLSQRRELSRQVAYYKLANNKKVKDVQRENSLLSNLVLKATELDLNLSQELISSVFKSIIDDSCNYQQEIIIQEKNLYRLSQNPAIKVSYLGLPGSYSYIASKKFASLIGKHAESTGFSSFSKVMDAITFGQTQFGILPLENTNSGSINEVYDLISKSSLDIVADLSLNINHVFCAKEYFDESEIEVIYTHAQPYEQSVVRIRELLPSAKIHFTESTTHAMQAVKNDPNPKAVAIGNSLSAQMYELVPISENISNSKHNQTRFIVLANSDLHEVLFTESVNYKTMLQIITPNESGSLAQALDILKKYHINLTKLESRPILGSP